MRLVGTRILISYARRDLLNASATTRIDRSSLACRPRPISHSLP